MLTLLGVVVVVAGFAVGFNPLLVVVAAALITGLTAHLPLLKVIAALGKAFNDNRLVTVALLVLPLVGVLERAGLQERARSLIARFRGVSLGALLIGYLAFRQITSALGLISIAGQAQSIRPLVAPMAEAAVEQTRGELDEETRQTVRAYAAATDNVGVFFGEDVFVAVGSILLMVGILNQSGLTLDPLQLSVWAIPSACAAFVIHALRLVLLDRRMRRPPAGGTAP
jgi:uncharacterized membrane protein